MEATPRAVSPLAPAFAQTVGAVGFPRLTAFVAPSAATRAA